MLQRRRWLLALALLLPLTPLAAMLLRNWREAGRRGGQRFAEPFRIAGNLYYVGANDATSYLVTGPQGHILIDGGYPASPALIMASIAKLGFDIRDVKVLLNTEHHFDHAGGLAELQDSSGAQLWLSEASASAVAGGGAGPDSPLINRLVVLTRFARYPAPRIAGVFRDGDTIRVGPALVIARLTPGHTQGCTSWEIPVRDGERQLRAVALCSLGVIAGHSYPGWEADLERSFRLLRGIPADIWMTVHARDWGRYRKYSRSLTLRNPVEAFVDPAGYRAYIDTAEARFRRGDKN